MKLDVITLQAVQNYGSALQAFATQEIFKKHGFDVTIINYVRENVRQENLLKTWSKGDPIKAIVMLPTVIRWKKVFSAFLEKYINLSDTIYTTAEDFDHYPLSADAYCTGSDQVWNSKWNKGILPCLYLDFVPPTYYKFSFAASFGQQILSKEEIDITKPYLLQYQKISVREEGAKKILEEQYHIPNVVHILDPTLCLPGSFWRKYSLQRKIKEDYLLVYNLNRSKEFDLYAKKMAKRTGLKLVRLCTRYDQFFRPGKSVLVPEVFDFVNLIDNAKYVLTDSFHATAFSLNMQTEPMCIYPKQFGGRLESILTQTNTLHKHVKDWNDFDIINRKIDFDNVEQILENERKKAGQFIDSLIADIQRYNAKRKKQYENGM